MKSPYIEHSKRYKRCRFTLWALIVCLLLLLFGCAKTTPASETIANSAQESLNSIENTLSNECKTKAVQSQIIAAKTAVQATITACENEKEVINQEKLRWKWSFLALTLIVLVHIVKKVLK